MKMNIHKTMMMKMRKIKRRNFMIAMKKDCNSNQKNNKNKNKNKKLRNNNQLKSIISYNKA